MNRQYEPGYDPDYYRDGEDTVMSAECPKCGYDLCPPDPCAYCKVEEERDELLQTQTATFVTALQSEITQLTKKRDELLPAMKLAQLYVANMAEAAAESSSDAYETAAMANDLRIINEAIAKAEGVEHE